MTFFPLWATTNPLIAPADWQDKLPRVENRPPSIVTPSRPTWELYLTGGEGYVGRDGIQSGGMFKFFLFISNAMLLKFLSF